jgi:hypothetical protein
MELLCEFGLSGKPGRGSGENAKAIGASRDRCLASNVLRAKVAAEEVVASRSERRRRAQRLETVECGRGTGQSGKDCLALPPERGVNWPSSATMTWDCLPIVGLVWRVCVMLGRRKGGIDRVLKPFAGV